MTAELAIAADEVQMQAGMERAGIEGDFGARVRYARRHMSRQEAHAAVSALKQQKQAALAALARKTALVLRSRLAAIRRARMRGTGEPSPR